MVGSCVHFRRQEMKYFAVLFRAYFPCNLGEDNDCISYAVPKAFTICHSALAHIADGDQGLDVRNIQTVVELSKDDVAVADGKDFLFRTAFVPHQRSFADLAAFELCVEECLCLFKFLGVSMLATQCLSGGVYRSFSWLLPMEDLVSPLLGLCAQVRVNG